jgi:hypothetical protein
MSNLILIGREAPAVSRPHSIGREMPDVSILLDTSIPYSEDELFVVYSEYLAEIKNKGGMDAVDAVDQELFQIYRDCFTTDLGEQAFVILEWHLKVDAFALARLTLDEEYRLMVYGGASYLAKKIQEKIHLPEKLAWALAILRLSVSWLDQLKAAKEELKKELFKNQIWKSTKSLGLLPNPRI